MAERVGSALLRSCSTARSLFIVAPYIKADALTRVLASARAVVSLTCVTRWLPGDIISGASDTACRTLVVEREGSFMLHPTLHAKYYRADDAVLVGSANLTGSAMGWVQRPNLEILCPAGGFGALEFEQKLLRHSREISDDEFARWDTLSRIDGQSRQNTLDPTPGLEWWRPATRDPRNLVLTYRERIDEIASSDEQSAARRDIGALSIPPSLTNDEVRAWMSTCLFAAPFTNSVLQFRDGDTVTTASTLAESFSLSLTTARRDLETAQNWISFLNL